MLSEQEIEGAHPDAFDFVFGNLADAKMVWFTRHLGGCRHCQLVVDEYGDIGRLVRDLPPHVEPPASLEDRTVAAMVAAMAAQRQAGTAIPAVPADDPNATRAYPVPQLRPSPGPGPSLGPEAGSDPEPGEPQPRPVTRLAAWRSRRGRLAAVAAAAAVIVIAALVVPLGLGGGAPAPTAAIPLHATTAAKLTGDGAAAGRVTAHQAGPSWTYVLTVHGLKPLPGNDVYECWYAASGSTKAHPLLVSGGTFVVDDSGSATVTMTSGVDPRDFRTMEITAESPGNGALRGAVLLTGKTL